MVKTSLTKRETSSKRERERSESERGNLLSGELEVVRLAGLDCEDESVFEEGKTTCT